MTPCLSKFAARETKLVANLGMQQWVYLPCSARDFCVRPFQPPAIGDDATVEDLLQHSSRMFHVLCRHIAA